ncbi:MAG: 50S ribosomal protein L3 N(5)-glutamine methyltransferase [Gammaproteobacteria bacterium]|nr:50S ribosomal protein L3 N(5)-glutamine methyltransferase [Gammaproteobacteria bacterium]
MAKQPTESGIESLQEIDADLSSGREFIYWAARCFESSDIFYGHGTDNPLDEAVALVMHVLELPFGCPDELLDKRISSAEKARIHELASRRIEHREPLAYLLGEAWFAGLRFKADARALVPRSPIAELVEQGYEPWVDAESVTAVLDLCTGGGSIAIATALALPQAEVDAVDLSAEALALAAENVALHEVGQRVTLFEGDLFAPLRRKRYDIIVSNPPYVDAEDMAALPAEFRREPELGLAAGDDGLDIVHRILAEAPRYLADEGILIVEVGNSAPALEATYPQVEFTWLDFERGGDGIFLLTSDQLHAIAEK